MRGRGEFGPSMTVEHEPINRSWYQTGNPASANTPPVGGQRVPRRAGEWRSHAPYAAGVAAAGVPAVSGMAERVGAGVPAPTEPLAGASTGNTRRLAGSVIWPMA
jgi:hypothetical protein